VFSPNPKGLHCSKANPETRETGKTERKRKNLRREKQRENASRDNNSTLREDFVPPILFFTTTIISVFSVSNFVFHPVSF
jgi:hypothetical protein